MFIDVDKAQDRIKYLNTQINKKQTDIRSLVSSLTTTAPAAPALQPSSEIFNSGAKESKQKQQPVATQQVNIPRLNTQLSQLKVKIDKSKTYLDQSNHLSHIINSDISSLEKRKNHAKSTLDLYTDIIELRGSIKMVTEALDKYDSDPNASLENIEMAAHFTHKSMSLMQVIKEQVQASPHSSEDAVLA